MIGELLCFVLAGLVIGGIATKLGVGSLGPEYGTRFVLGKPKHGGPRLSVSVAFAVCAFAGIGAYYLLTSQEHTYRGIPAGIYIAISLGYWFQSYRHFRVTDKRFSYLGNTSYPLTCLNDALWDAEAEVLFFRSGRYPESPERDVALPLTPAAWELLQKRAAEQKVATA